MPPRMDPPNPRRNSQPRRAQSGTRRRSSGAAADNARPAHPSQRPRAGPEQGQRRRDDPQSQTRRRRSSGAPHSRPHVEIPKTIEPNVRPLPYTQHSDPNVVEAGMPSGRTNTEIGRKKSLVRPERRRVDLDAPDFHYRQHAQRMNVMPSTTGLQPQMEEEPAILDSESTTLTKSNDYRERREQENGGTAVRRQPNKLVRKATHQDSINEARKQKIRAASGTPSLWITYCHLVTFWCPNLMLRCFGKRQKQEQRAWREKMGLISIILLIMAFVGYLTFGFTATVCPSGGPTRLKVNNVGSGYMIFHGEAYDLTQSHHPLARGVPDGANVLWDLSEKHGGQDGSFLFQNVNGACKGLIVPAPKSDVPTDSSGSLAWYFPCTTFNQDGSSKPNLTIPYYLGYSCHTMQNARQSFYNLRTSGDVYFTWDDIRNSSRNLLVYSGDVLDLDLLDWFNKTQVLYPSMFDDIRTNPALRGIDTTLAFSSGEHRQVAQCLQQIIKVGSIDTETIGCIASKVVLYVSLIFILAIVFVKFVFAVLFQWFFSRKFAAEKTSMSGNKKKRRQQIEDWTDDIYRPAPKITDPAPNYTAAPKRGSFFPTTSRFTSPYALDRAQVRQPPTTMTQQSSRMGYSGSGSATPYGGNARSDLSLPAYSDSPGRPGILVDGRPAMTESSGYGPVSTRYSSVMPETEMSGPQGFIHGEVVPQPPAEWQPFGFPLAHAICLVTAYSEGPDGIRTTLDSVAMTDYPNSHKLMFVVCDGLIKGKGETMSTPDVCLSMMKDHAVLPDEVQPFSYVAVASGSKRHNMAKIYAGFYDYGENSIIPVEKQQRVPMLLVVKCGTPAESDTAKPGNRGKRDSQIILMSFLQKVMFDERMTELEFEVFNGIWKITGISPDFYEIVLMVDADTKVFPDSMTHMVSAMVKDPEIMGLCGETKIANKRASWVSMIQVFEYFISHHQAKSFESMFGGVTCLPGCFCMYRIKTPKGGQNYWVPILANPDIVEHYSENVVDTLHKKNLLLLGEDRYLSTLMLKTFPKRKQVFVPQAVCKTTVPEAFKVLLSQRRRWINSTVHNLMELVLVRDLCGTFCFSMQFVVFIELVGTLVLPAAISFTIYLIAIAIKAAVTHTEAPTIPLILLALILGLPGALIVITAHSFTYVLWMFVYLLSLPVWNFVLPVYAFWHFDDFSWGDTRQTAGALPGQKDGGHDGDGEFDSSQITMKRWGDFEQERRLRNSSYGGSHSGYFSNNPGATETDPSVSPYEQYRNARHERKPSNLGHYVEEYHDYP